MVDSVKNYGIAGVAANVQLGKQGPVIVGSDPEQISVQTAGGEPASVQVAAGTEPEHAVQLDQLGTAAEGKISFIHQTLNYDDGVVSLGTAQEGAKIFSISLTPGNAWTSADGDTHLQIGDAGDPERLLSFDDFENFDTQVVTDVGVTFTEITEILATITRGAAVAGTVSVTIKYVGSIAS
jgi:hypothetical protein